MKLAKVVVIVRSDFERQYWWHPALGMWLLSLMYEKTYKMQVEVITGAHGYAASANIGARTFIEKHPDAEWYCQIDNDTVPPENILRMLDDLPEDVAIISPLVYMLRDVGAFPQQGHYVENDGFCPLTVEPRERREVDRAGGGCIFIRRRVFDTMDRPYFKTLHDEETQITKITDDVYFQNRARDRGFKLYCDTRFVASHFHTRDLSP